MHSFNPQDVSQWAAGQWRGSLGEAISGFTNDTRALKPGDCFVALKTDVRDGHDFLNSAAASGATAALVEHANADIDLPQLEVKDCWKAIRKIANGHRHSFKGSVIGITGSCGKTSTKDLLQRLLGQSDTHATHGNLNNLLGVPLTLLGIKPDRHTRAVVEAGLNTPGEMDALARTIQPDSSIVTLVAPVHVGFLGDINSIAGHKAKLCEATKPGGRCFMPVSCLQFKAFQSLEKELHVLIPEGEGVPSVSGSVTPYFYTVSREARGPRIELTLMGPDQVKRTFSFRRVSAGMAQNVALAILTASSEGVSDALIQERLEGWVSSQWRGEVFRDATTYYYVDCYNASPPAMCDAFGIFGELFPESMRRSYVLGGMGELGDEAPSLHHWVGESLSLRPQDRVFLHGQHVEHIQAGLLASGVSPDAIMIAETREDLAKALKHVGGAVLLKASKVYEFWKLLPSEATRIPYQELEPLLC